MQRVYLAVAASALVSEGGRNARGAHRARSEGFSFGGAKQQEQDGSTHQLVTSHGLDVLVQKDPKIMAPPRKAGKPSKGVEQFKYAIVGGGVAGKAALDTLLAQEPNARILVVDSAANPSAHLTYVPRHAPTLQKQQLYDRVVPPSHPCSAGCLPPPQERTRP